MRGPEHVSIAVVTTAGALFLMGHGHIAFDVPTLTVMGVAAVGSLVPDIDHPKAWISNRIPATLLGCGLVFLLGFAAASRYSASLAPAALGASLWTSLIVSARPVLGWAWTALLVGATLLVVSVVLAKMIEHRGPTHSLAVGGVATVVACIAFAVAPGQPWTLGLWFGWGYLSHLLADLTTPMGCPALLWPLRGGEARAGSMPAPLPVSITVAGGDPALMHVAASQLSSAGVPGAPGGTASYGAGGASAPSTAAEARTPNPQIGVEASVAPAEEQTAPTSSQRSCPNCGGALVLRQARRGAHAGNTFHGCANYPRCRYVENVVS